MNRRFALEQDIARRIAKFQALMREKNIGALVVPATGSPGMFGMGKYLTNLVTWAGRSWVVLGADRLEPALVIPSPYGGNWNKQEATTSWVEYTMNDAYGRVIAIAKELAGSNKRIGVEHVAQSWVVGEWDRIRKDLSDYEFVDISKETDAIRAIKSRFELEHFNDLGALMTAGFAAFEQVARPGVLAWEAASAAEEVVKAAGCYWGRQKYSMDLRPYTIPTALDRRFTDDDIFVFELVYNSPLGYWCEMTNLYSFRPLPPTQQAQLDAQERVIEACALIAKPGTPIGKIAETSNQSWTDLGFKPIGKHTPDCHSIGLDESDGPSSWWTPDELLENNMVLSFHPSTLLEGDRAFLLSDNYVVTPGGAVRLSPKHWYHRVIDA